MCHGACINVRGHIRVQSSPATLYETGSLVCCFVHEASQPSSFREHPSLCLPSHHKNFRITDTYYHTQLLSRSWGFELKSHTYIAWAAANTSPTLR